MDLDEATRSSPARHDVLLTTAFNYLGIIHVLEGMEISFHFLLIIRNIAARWAATKKGASSRTKARDNHPLKGDANKTISSIHPIFAFLEQLEDYLHSNIKMQKF